MAINLRKEVGQKSTVGQLRSEFKAQHKITVNEPAQTHFSAEGVQAYSPQEILALKARAERVTANAQKDGEYIKTQAYKIDQQIEFDRPSTATDQGRVTLKPKKGKKEPLEQAKPEVKVKPSVKNQLGRANRKLVKRDKEKEQKEQYEKRLEDLKEEYKKHFGGSLKESGGKKKKETSQKKEDEEGGEENEFEVEEQEGEQCLPGQKKENYTITKAGQNADDSFEEVEWQGPARSVQSKGENSRLNASKASNYSYSQKLGNAVHLLFD